MSEARRRRRHPRAVAVAVAGALALIAAGGFGTPALRPLGIGLLVLGAGSIMAVELAARGLRVQRTIDRDTLPAGERGTAVVRLQGWPVERRLLSFLDWDLRPGLPEAGRTEIRKPGRIRGEFRQEISFTDLPRGEHRFGPPGVSIGDPFRLSRVRRAATKTDSVLVLPRTVPVLIPFWESGAARRAGQRDGLLRGRAELGGVRDYEPGDPLSLIHWSQTARRGRLQTKELHGESGRGASLVVLLDASAASAASDGRNPDSPFEVAVSAAASLVATCAARGDQVGLDHTGSVPISLPTGTPPGAIERELAIVGPDGHQHVSVALRAIAGRAATPRTIVIVTAAGDRGLGAATSQARAAGISVAAVLTGSARAYGPELRRAGAWVTDVAGADGLAAALDGSTVNARRA